jgi:hypothetical protein
MAEQAREVIVLTESEKFLHRGVEGIARVEDVACVYTDDRIPSDKEAFLIENGVIVHKVPAERKLNEAGVERNADGFVTESSPLLESVTI